MSDDSRPAMTPQQDALTAEGGSALALYRQTAVGDASLGHFAAYELLTFLFGGWPGLPGLGVRSVLYPQLFSRCGSRPALGRGMVVRCPRQIEIGKRLLADDYSVLDVRGEGGKIVLGDYVSIGRFSTITAKRGIIEIGDGSNIGSYCRVATQSQVRIGKSVLIAAYAYIGPGNHQQGDEEVPLIARQMEIRGGVDIGDHAWIGTRATVLDGVSIGAHSIVGAHSLVREDVPAHAIVAGCPAKVIGKTNGV